MVRRGPRALPLRGEVAAPGMRIGVFGGTFDPPHDGHLHVARTALQRLNLDRVWWLVSPQNPLKPTRDEDYARRIAAVRELAHEPRMVVSDIERRIGARYTIETLQTIVRRWPATRFVWLMGSDSLATFHTWRDWRVIMKTAPVAVIARRGDALRALHGPMATHFRSARVCEIDAPALVEKSPAAWSYLPARLNSASSTALRDVGVDAP